MHRCRFQSSRKESHPLSGTDLFTGAGECLPMCFIDTLKKQKFHGRAGIASYAQKPGRDDLSIIDDENIEVPEDRKNACAKLHPSYRQES